MNDRNITGIILAGGKKPRFGRDKALIHYKENTMLKNAANILEQFTDQIIISSNSPYHKEYGYQVVPDCVEKIGPMGGIITALKASGTLKNIVLAIDLPLIPPQYIKYLLDRCHGNTITVGMDTQHKMQPLCGIFHRKAIPHIEANILKHNYDLELLIKSIPKTSVERPPKDAYFYSDRIFSNIKTLDAFYRLIDDHDKESLN